MAVCLCSVLSGFWGVNASEHARFWTCAASTAALKITAAHRGLTSRSGPGSDLRPGADHSRHEGHPHIGYRVVAQTRGARLDVDTEHGALRAHHFGDQQRHIADAAPEIEPLHAGGETGAVEEVRGEILKERALLGEPARFLLGIAGRTSKAAAITALQQKLSTG